MKINRTLKGSEFQEKVLELLTSVEEYNHGWQQTGVSGKASQAFWTIWRERKAVVKAAGFEVVKDGSDFVVSLRERDLGISLEDALKRSKAAQAERAFWADSANWHLLTNSKNTD